MACIRGHTEIVERLIQEGAGINSQDELGSTHVIWLVVGDIQR